MEQLLRDTNISALGLAGTHLSLRGGILPLSEMAVHSSQVSASQLRRNNFLKANAKRQGLRAPRTRM